MINNYVSPAVAGDVPDNFDLNGPAAALWVGAVICGGSLLSAAMLTPVEKAAKAKLRDGERVSEDLKAALLEAPEPKVRSISAERLSTSALSLKDVEEDDEEIRLTDVKNFGSIFWLLSLSCLVVYGCVLPFNSFASGILSERNYFVEPPSSCALQYMNQCTGGSLTTIDNPSRDDGDFTSGLSNCPANSDYAPALPSSLLPAVTCDSDPSLDCKKSSYSFNDLKASDIDCTDDFYAEGCFKNYCDAYETATKTSDSVMSIPYFISAGLSPPLGYAVDKVGRRAMIASIAPAMLIWVHMQLGFGSGSPILPLIGQGIAYSLFAAVLWPSVPFSVEKKSVGTAYGLITAIQNAGLALFPVVISGIQQSSGGKYLPWCEVFFVCCAIAGVIVGFFLNVVDAKKGGKLNSLDGKGMEAEEE